MKSRRRRNGAVAALCGAVLLACFESAPPKAPAEPEVTLQPVTFAAWQERLREYAPGIVIVDFWATWCVSCIERFPKMVEMEKRYRGRGVRFVSLSLDDVNDPGAVAEAEDFLLEVGAVFDNYLMQESMRAAFEKLDLIGIPVVLIYDRRGQERVRLTGDDPNKQFTDADVENALNKLLSES